MKDKPFAANTPGSVDDDLEMLQRNAFSYFLLWRLMRRCGPVARVALVEKNLTGGDCLNVGCMPSKAILRSALFHADLRRAPEFRGSGPVHSNIDFGKAMERMQRIRAHISHNDSAKRFRELCGGDPKSCRRILPDPADSVPEKVYRALAGVVAIDGHEQSRNVDKPLPPSVPGVDMMGIPIAINRGEPIRVLVRQDVDEP